MLCMIYKLYKRAEEELRDAEYYIEKAEKSKDKEDEKVYYDIANDEIKHAGYLVNIAKRKTEKLSEGPDKDENVHNGMSSLDIIKEMHSEYMHNLAKVKELMNLRQ